MIAFAGLWRLIVFLRNFNAAFLSRRFETKDYQTYNITASRMISGDVLK